MLLWTPNSNYNLHKSPTLSQLTTVNTYIHPHLPIHNPNCGAHYHFPVRATRSAHATFVSSLTRITFRDSTTYCGLYCVDNYRLICIEMLR
jgi:hypothetical protein